VVADTSTSVFRAATAQTSLCSRTSHRTPPNHRIYRVVRNQRMSIGSCSFGGVGLLCMARPACSKRSKNTNGFRISPWPDGLIK
jgi:hypothetical protein